jgi:RNA polymerase sigma-70 factor (ECF subfamily)
MLEDKLLIWRLKRGSREALRGIYEKYKNDLLALAIALSNDKTLAEDVVHDVFVSFVQIAGKLELKGSLKSYLSASVANRVRNVSRAKREETIRLGETEIASTETDRPDRLAMSAELVQRIGYAIAQLPYEQREVIILHVQGGMKFSQIAKSRGVSINTIQSRYRYGLSKLQSMLDGEVEK